MALTGAYQSMYDVGLKRLQQNEARRRAIALQGAARSGVNTSGVGQIPMEAIGKDAAQREAELGSEVEMQQDQERLADKRFTQQKELMQYQADLAEIAAARQRKRDKAAAKSGMWSDVIGAATGGIGGVVTKKLADKYL